MSTRKVVGIEKIDLGGNVIETEVYEQPKEKTPLEKVLDALVGKTELWWVANYYNENKSKVHSVKDLVDLVDTCTKSEMTHPMGNWNYKDSSFKENFVYVYKRGARCYDLEKTLSDCCIYAISNNYMLCRITLGSDGGYVFTFFDNHQRYYFEVDNNGKEVVLK